MGVNGLTPNLLLLLTRMRAPCIQSPAIVSNFYPSFLQSFLQSFLPSIFPFLSSHITYLVHISSPPYLRTSYADVFFTVVKQGDSIVVL